MYDTKGHWCQKYVLNTIYSVFEEEKYPTLALMFVRPKVLLAEYFLLACSATCFKYMGFLLFHKWSRVR